MKILITGAWKQSNEYIVKIENMGNTVKFIQNETDELPCDYDWIEGIIGNGIFLYHKINKFINLKYIQLTSAGFDRVPMDYVRTHNIVIHNAKGVYSIPMAEFAIAGVLNLYKRLDFFRDNQKKQLWEKHRELQELYQKTVCIIGCGSVGRECAKRFKAFGCIVYGIDVYQQDFYDGCFCLNEINCIIGKVDIVIISIPLTNDTKHLFNQELFENLKNNSIIVNIARGAVVDTNALLKALDNKLSGAVLDVFEEEPLGNSPLWGKKNVIITPHNSFIGNNNDIRMSKLIMKNLERVEYENISDITKE